MGEQRVRSDRSERRGEPKADVAPDGLSRRGWLVLVGITASVIVAVLAGAVFIVAHPAGDSQRAASRATSAGSLHTPERLPAPAPLGLPPRPTATHIATGPSVPLASLKPGDCLQTFDSKWAAGYPVVDCSSPHIAQLLSEGVLPEPTGAAFPGTDALDTQVSDLCEPSLDWGWVAVWNEDVQLGLRYPNTSETWSTGARSYYCFVYTFSRHVLTGSALAKR